MDYQEFNKLITILRKKPSWFQAQAKEDIDAKLDCLRRFKERESASDISCLIEFLTDEYELIRSKVAELIIILFQRLKSKNELYECLKYVPIKTEDIRYYKDVFSVDVFIYLMAIASLNKSGYVREVAVRELAGTKSSLAIKYILLRLADWVPQVSESAKRGIRSFFESQYIEAFIGELVLIEQLPQTKRVELSTINSEILQFLLSKELTPDFFRSLSRQVNDKARVLYIRRYISSREISESLVRLIITDSIFLVRLAVLKYLAAIESGKQEQILGLLLKDKSSQVRLSALYSVKSFVAKYKETILSMVSDQSASVRDLARYLLKEDGFDFKVIYRERIQQNTLVVGSIQGLSEIGTKDDLELFKTYIKNKEINIKLGCLVGINRLDSSTAVEYALGLLSHASARIRNRCIQILSSACNEEVLTSVRSLYTLGNIEQRKTALKFFNRVGGWGTLANIILGLTDQDEIIQNLAWSFLQKWKDKSMRLFTTPSTRDLETARSNYSLMNWDKTKKSRERENLWNDLGFSLR